MTERRPLIQLDHGIWRRACGLPRSEPPVHVVSSPAVGFASGESAQSALVVSWSSPVRVTETSRTQEYEIEREPPQAFGVRHFLQADRAGLGTQWGRV